MRSPPAGLRPVVSVSKTISRMARLTTRREAETSEDRSDLGARSRRACPPVSMTKSARARFSASGIWRARIASSLAAVMPGRASTRARWTSAGAETTMTLSNAASPPVSNSKGMSNSNAGASPWSAMKRVALVRGPRDGPAPPARRARPGRPAPARQARRGRPRRRASCRESAPRSPRPAPAGPCSRRTSASASNTGTPASSNIPATVDLPMPIDPVSASLIMAPAFATIRHRGRAADPRRRTA